MNSIITIDRQYGSAGRKIGSMLAERMEIPCYDSALIGRIAEKTGLDEQFVRESSEYSSSPGVLLSVLSGRDQYGYAIQDEVWRVQRNVIRELADKPCVIIGRCADYILRDRPDILSVFIHADEDIRIRRVKEEYHDLKPGEDALRKIRQMDRRRKSYCQLYTDIYWGEARFYDLCLDSGKFGIEKCVEIIESLY